MDSLDLLLLKHLQKDADIALKDLSGRVKMSKTACWNRLQRLREQGVILGKQLELDRMAIGLPIVIFLSITVGNHSTNWVEKFHFIIQKFSEIVEVHRLTGEGADYQLKVVCTSMEAYDKFQQRLIGEINFTSMSTKISLKEIKKSAQFPLFHLENCLKP